MKKTIFASLTILTFSALMFCCSNAPKQEKVLRHVVMFGFKPEVSAQQIKEVEEAFCALPSQIDLIKGYEWGTDCSPEGLQQGLTHCFFLTFHSDADRDAYLIHPAHKAFGKVLGDKASAVTVSNGSEVCGGECVFVRIWFFLRQVARYLPFAIYKEYCGCRVRK